ncbi:MAG: Gfo/Idh/MocA family oxidoreductase [Chloroflexota bacterium]|nr:Gfo/Idh/MocA family oxidoreductase [Chloroflexota bacterium]
MESQRKQGRVRVAVVGVGNVAQLAHLPVLSGMRAATIAAVCDTDPERAKRAAERWGAGHAWTDYEAMLREEELDLVDVCTPPGTHLHIVKKALERGIPCIVEKPLTATPREAEEMAHLAQKSGRVFPLYNLSVMPCLRQASALVERGAIGEVVGVDIKGEWDLSDILSDAGHWAHRLQGGVFGESIPHLTMVLAQFMGSVDRVAAITARLSPNGHVSGDQLRVVVANKTSLGSIALSLTAPTSRFMVDITGARGSLSIDGNSQAVVRRGVVRHPSDALARGGEALNDVRSRAWALAWTGLNYAIGRYRPWVYGHQYLLERAVQAVLSGAEYPLRLETAVEAIKYDEAILSQVPTSTAAGPDGDS